jgi:hypothetical protein
MAGKFEQIQQEVIDRYRVTVSDGSDCPCGWRRTHAHVKERKICKWKQANSIRSTFTLLHEIGHIETTTSSMRRCESEYFATVWAIQRCREYNIPVPKYIIERYQAYIDMEKARGQRRGGTCYGKLDLWKVYDEKP